MTKEEIFEAWAPRGAAWSPWAKPVLFSHLDRIGPPAIVETVSVPDVSWAAESVPDTAFVVDLPGAASVAFGLTLATIGYRPVPLFNAVPEPLAVRSMVDVRPAMHAITDAAPLLRDAPLRPDAPPAFLLDADRNHPSTAAAPGVFDNRSISLPTDFPSGHLLLSRRIRRVVLVTAIPVNPSADLSHTLRRWQLDGLSILQKALNDSDRPRTIVVARPHGFRVLCYNFFATLGLMRSPLGGFGGTLPMPSSG